MAQSRDPIVFHGPGLPSSADRFPSKKTRKPKNQAPRLRKIFPILQMSQMANCENAKNPQYQNTGMRKYNSGKNANAKTGNT